jgi:hypothetical protein
MSKAPNKEFVHTIRLLKRTEVSPPRKNGGGTLVSPSLRLNPKHLGESKKSRFSQSSSVELNDITCRFSLTKLFTAFLRKSLRTIPLHMSVKRQLRCDTFTTSNLYPLHTAISNPSSRLKASEGTSLIDATLSFWGVNRGLCFAVNLTNKRQEA